MLQAIHTGVPGRVRLRVPGLRRQPQLARAIEAALAGLPSVEEVRAAPRTGTLLVRIAPGQAPPDWQPALASLLGRDDVGARLASPRVTRTRRLLRRALVGALSHLHHRPAPRTRRAPPDRAPPSARTEPARVSEAAPSPDVAWHSLSVSEIEERVGLACDGRDRETVAARQREDGPNALAPAPRRSELRILGAQLASTPVAMLGASAVLSVATGGLGEAAAIAAVLGINAAIGYVTESGAERTIEALTRTPQPSVPVWRSGAELEVPVTEVVRGDVLLLRSGVFVAADARVFQAQDLTIDESSLTGESMPVAKSEAPIGVEATPLAERTSMVYRGTLVTGGSGRALVVSIGQGTEIGRIQALTSHVEARSTPMQQQLDRLGRQLALGAGLACVATLGVGLLRGRALLPMFRTAISLGVAAVPEGLPTVAITTLALGLSRMRDERVVVRRLAAVETLGSVQVVCLDKTGTLTENRMTVAAVTAGQRAYRVESGRFVDGARGEAALGPDLEWLLRLAVLCNEVDIGDENGVRVLKGSPTEAALVQLALDAGIDALALRAHYPLCDTQRRAQARNYMTTRHAVDGHNLLAVKGRPSEVLGLCQTCLRDGQRVPLGERERAQIETENERMAGRALRVLGFAFRDDAPPGEELAPELVWVGLIGMEDPPRRWVPEVIARLRAAGVRSVMITGDQSATAHAVGRAVGLARDGGHLEIVDSTRLDQIDVRVLQTLAQRADVFARVSPAHKLQIVQALQSAGLVVAMTGDGVNDGPAVKAADIGIAMGAAGSVAAREVADVVLEDDDLRSLVVAIEQGRTIYDDIRKAVHFILATNLSEILYTFICVSSGLGEPLTALQLLWINLLTDVLPELALAVLPPEADVLARPPRAPERPMFTRRDLQNIGGEGLAITASALSAYFWSQRRSNGCATTLGFTSLTLAQLFHAISARSETHSLFDHERLANDRWLPLALGSTFALQVAASASPSLRRLLQAKPLDVLEWGVALGSALAPLGFNEAVKVARRRARGALAGSGPLPLPHLVPSE